MGTLDLYISSHIQHAADAFNMSRHFKVHCCTYSLICCNTVITRNMAKIILFSLFFVKTDIEMKKWTFPYYTI